MNSAGVLGSRLQHDPDKQDQVLIILLSNILTNQVSDNEDRTVQISSVYKENKSKKVARFYEKRS